MRIANLPVRGVSCTEIGTVTAQQALRRAASRQADRCCGLSSLNPAVQRSVASHALERHLDSASKAPSASFCICAVCVCKQRPGRAPHWLSHTCAGALGPRLRAAYSNFVRLPKSPPMRCPSDAGAAGAAHQMSSIRGHSSSVESLHRRVHWNKRQTGIRS